VDSQHRCHLPDSHICEADCQVDLSAKLRNSCITPHIAFELWISIPSLFGCCAKEHCIQNVGLIGVCDSRLFRSACRRNEVGLDGTSVYMIVHRERALQRD
jgi:hypothetical protein